MQSWTAKPENRRKLDYVLIAWLVKNCLISLLVEVPVCWVGPQWPSYAAAKGNFLLKLSLDLLVSTGADPVFLKLPDWLHVATCVHGCLIAPFYVTLAIAVGQRRGRVARVIARLLGPILFYAMFFFGLMEILGSIPTANFVAWVAMNVDYLIGAAILPWMTFRHLDSKDSSKKQ